MASSISPMLCLLSLSLPLPFLEYLLEKFICSSNDFVVFLSFLPLFPHIWNSQSIPILTCHPTGRQPSLRPFSLTTTSIQQLCQLHLPPMQLRHTPMRNPIKSFLWRWLRMVNQLVDHHPWWPLFLLSIILIILTLHTTISKIAYLMVLLDITMTTTAGNNVISPSTTTLVEPLDWLLPQGHQVITLRQEEEQTCKYQTASLFRCWQLIYIRPDNMDCGSEFRWWNVWKLCGSTKM